MSDIVAIIIISNLGVLRFLFSIYLLYIIVQPTDDAILIFDKPNTIDYTIQVISCILVIRRSILSLVNKKTVEIFKVLGDETRLKIIKLLASNTVESLCVTDLAKMIGISQQAASQHIKLMKMAGFLEPNKKGYHVYYTINMSNLIKMKKNIDELFEMAFVKCTDCEKFPNCNECIK